MFNENFNVDKGNMNFFKYVGMMIFIFGTYTLDTFISSNKLEIIYIILTVSLFVFSYLAFNNKISLYFIDIMWFVFFFYFLFNLLIYSKFTIIYIYDLIAFAFVVIFILLAKLNENYFIYSIKVIFILSIIYAFSSILQFVNMDFYSKYILPFFTISEQEELLKIYNRGNYTGITWQTAFISGYMVFGLGFIYFTYKYLKNNWYKLIMVIITLLLLMSLFMAGKRAHLIFMIISLVITTHFSTQLKSNINIFMKRLFLLFFSVFSFIYVMFFIDFEQENQVSKVINRIIESLDGLSQGEDITSGRITLYEFALSLFKEQPIVGIGWRSFIEATVGVINKGGSHPHNIYIQLLTELGLIGFILFIIPVLFAYILTIRQLKKFDELRINMKWKVLLQYSLYIQTFFLLYGITGNLLTDRLYLYSYMFSVSILLSYIHQLNLLERSKMKCIE